MNSTNLKIGGAAASLAVLLIGRLNGLITDQMLLWAAIIFGLAVASSAFSIGATEWFKRRKFSQAQIECINDPHSVGCDKEKRKTHDFAVRSGACAMFLCGVIFVKFQAPDWQTGIVIGVFWLILCGIVGVTSPLLWRLFRKRFLTVAGEHEALDRPTDKPDL